eukprot:6206377-Pleurochrysis_carterae.AAC.2
MSLPFLALSSPSTGLSASNLLPFAGDVKVHPAGPSGSFAAIADALREAHSLGPYPPPPTAPSSASFSAVANDLYFLTPAPMRLAPFVPARATRIATPLPSPSAYAHGLQHALAPPFRPHDHLP